MQAHRRHHWTRRDVIRAGASMSALAALPGCSLLTNLCKHDGRGGFSAVDVHCHIFNAKDLPVAGFLRKWIRTSLAKVLRGDAAPDPVHDASLDQTADRILLPLRPVLAAFQAGIQAIAPGADEDLGAAPADARPFIAKDLADARLRPEIDRAAREELARVAQDARANARTRRVAPLGARPEETSLAEVLTTLRVERLSGFSQLLGTIEQDEATAAPLGIRALPTLEAGEEVEVATRAYDVLLLSWLSDRLNFFLVGTHSRRSIGREVAQTYPEAELLAPALVDFDEWIDAGSGLGLTRAPVTPAAQVLLLEQLSRRAMQGQLTGTAGGTQRLHGYAAFCPAREISLAEASYPKVPAADSKWAGPDTAYHEETEPIGDWHLAGPTRVEPQPSFRLARHAIERAGFLGVKLYPPVGFRPVGNESLFDVGSAQAEHRGARLDNALCRLYSWCQEKQVPVLVHCGVGNSFSLGAMECPHPAHWGKVLERYPKLRLCLGHLGHVEGLPKRPPGGYTPEQIEQGWPAEAARLMERYDHVYADIADFHTLRASPYVEPGDTEVLRYLMRTYPRFRGRLLYGSDWFMNNLLGEHDQYLKRFHAGFAEVFEEETGYDAAAVFEGNARRFLFGEGEGNPNRRRLLAYYQAAHVQAPPWLTGRAA